MCTAEIKGNKLVITIDANLEPKPSKSGKSLLVATTNGNIPTTATVKGRSVTLGLNAYIALRD